MAARTRSNGSVTGYAVALVLFVMLALLSGLMAAIFYAQTGAATQERDEAKQKLAQIAKQDEIDSPIIVEMRKSPGGTSVVGQLLAENRGLKLAISASPTATLETIDQEIKSMGLTQGQTLTAEIRRLRAELVAAQQRQKQAEEQVQVEKKRLTQCQEEKVAQDQAYKQSLSEFDRKLAALQGDLSRFRQSTDTQRQALEDQIATVRTEKQTVIDEQRQQIEQSEQQLAVMKQRVDELKRILPETGLGVPDPTREPDGTISALLPEEKLVYIDRGWVDRVMLGMTFEVFDKSTGVVIDDLGENRGYATIEVVNVSERASLARVVRIERGRFIDEGDLIANVIYDPNAVYEFYVFGKFDIDNTGQSTSTDRRRIETIITQWGGVLTPQLSFNTDYLVLGQEPDLPKPLSPDEIDPQVIAERTEQMKLYKDYQNLVAEAKAMSIPILNQNRFLALVGYYRR